MPCASLGFTRGARVTALTGARLPTNACEQPLRATREHGRRIAGRGGRLGRYSLVAPVPTADGHDLWLAKAVEATSPNAAVLLRLVPDEIARDGARLEAALAETAVAAACEHPHLARLIEIAEEGGRCYLVSEYVSGRTLRQIGRASCRERVCSTV